MQDPTLTAATPIPSDYSVPVQPTQPQESHVLAKESPHSVAMQELDNSLAEENFNSNTQPSDTFVPEAEASSDVYVISAQVCICSTQPLDLGEATSMAETSHKEDKASASNGRKKRCRAKSLENKEEVENQRMSHIAVERSQRKQMNEFRHILVSRAIAFETDLIVDMRSLSLSRSSSGDLASDLHKFNAAEERLDLRRSTWSSGKLGGSSTSSYRSTSSIHEIDLLPNDSTQDLRSADRVIVAGNGCECFHIFGVSASPRWSSVCAHEGSRGSASAMSSRWTESILEMDLIFHLQFSVNLPCLNFVDKADYLQCSPTARYNVNEWFDLKLVWPCIVNDMGTGKDKLELFLVVVNEEDPPNMQMVASDSIENQEDSMVGPSKLIAEFTIGTQGMPTVLQGIHECLEIIDWATHKFAADALVMLASYSGPLITNETSPIIEFLEACSFDNVKPQKSFLQVESSDNPLHHNGRCPFRTLATAPPPPAVKYWVIFVEPYEHHSKLLSWRQSLAQVIEVGLDRSGRISATELERLLGSPEFLDLPKLGSFSACSNVTGIQTDTRAIARLLHRSGAYAFGFEHFNTSIAINFFIQKIMRNFLIFSPTDEVLYPYRLKRVPPSTSGDGTVRFVGGYDVKDTIYCEDPAIVQKIRAAMAEEPEPDATDVNTREVRRELPSVVDPQGSSINATLDSFTQMMAAMTHMIKNI
ncbi:hypothetical protein KFK09_000021 [Dendrobium nobile]|uniref:TORTIFOLIA1/SINE1-2 N-terminal domain-containing protein n=1 Tax=Dendrobium nobile TaxID=94219 RepID=A0A8T3CBZ6_DENNO|nr:hypothetical protein KFK09_000021 [Dendrobium nobile]